MYRCKECGEYFEIPVRQLDKDTGYVENTCPFCGDDYLEEAHKCPICREWTVEDYCENCTENVSYGLAELKDRLHIDPDIFKDIVFETLEV